MWCWCAANYATSSNRYIYDNTPLSALQRRNATIKLTAAIEGCKLEGRDTAGIAAAVGAAADADAVVVVLGLHAGRPGESYEGEDWDREELLLPWVQQQLLEAVAPDVILFLKEYHVRQL